MRSASASHQLKNTGRCVKQGFYQLITVQKETNKLLFRLQDHGNKGCMTTVDPTLC